MFKGSKDDALTSLRFFAALCMFFIHANLVGFIPPLQHDRSWQALSLAVSFFFALSGFVLTCSYSSFEGPEQIYTYFAKRIGRIVPLYYLTAIPFLFVPKLQHFVESPLKEVFAYTFALQDWANNRMTITPLNPPGHSLSSECFFYMLFPLVVTQNKRYLPLFSCIAALLYILAWNDMVKSGGIFLLPLCGFLYFVTGIWSHAVTPNAKGPRNENLNGLKGPD